MYAALILAPFFCVIILNLPLRALMKKAAFWLCLSLALAQILFVFCPPSCWGEQAPALFGAVFQFNLLADGLATVMLFCIAMVILFSLFMARQMIAEEEERFNFINLLLIMLFGMNGLVLANDIFSLYVYLEVATITSFILISFHKDLSALEGAFKYVILSVAAGVMMLSGIALLLVVAGSTDFSALNAGIKASPDKFFISFAAAIFLCGVFIKAGLAPFHGWLPDAYSSAPAPVSVLLAGIVTKAVGVYTLIRVSLSVFGLDGPLRQVLLLTGGISVVLGAVACFAQSDFKRMLAYSSISQVGYIVLGLGSGTALGLAAAVFHLFNHAVFKSLLFINAAAVEGATGRRDIQHMSGLAQKMPLTGLTSLLGSLSCAGIPPLAGFWSKLMIIISLWLSGNYFFAALAALASVLTLGYFLRLQRKVFFGVLGEEFSQVKEAGPGLLVPALILGALTLAAGLGFGFILNSLLLPLSSLIR